MAEKNCSQCGAPLEMNANVCPYCGTPVETTPPPQPYVPPQPTYPPPQNYIPQGNMYQPQVPPLYQPMFEDGVDPSWPIKNKTVAGILAILLGTLGVHKFYLGKTTMGIIYLVLTFTAVLAFVPALLGLIEGITYLTQSEHNFQVNNHVRTH